jgi:2-polyprenyl-6-methoxyphenol hydroxylase-like FAD-dependent oxidoreductase
MEKQNEGWLLHFKNNTTAYADIVIACDGANSKIRPYITDSKAFIPVLQCLKEIFCRQNKCSKN